MSDPFADLPKHHFGAILADPPWNHGVFSATGYGHGSPKPVNYIGKPPPAYSTMATEELLRLPIADLCADNAVLFIWVIWHGLEDALNVIKAWQFEFKNCAFCWMKAHAGQIDLFRDDMDALVGLGAWTRNNSEPCLLGTRGKPKRLHADVRQGIIAPRREHSRKPDGIHERIERLVAGPYLELFARQTRPGWTCWGNETDKFKEAV